MVPAGFLPNCTLHSPEPELRGDDVNALFKRVYGLNKLEEAFPLL